MTFESGLFSINLSSSFYPIGGRHIDVHQEQRQACMFRLNLLPHCRHFPQPQLGMLFQIQEFVLPLP